ncbi:MAG: adenylyl-sulfate kinase [Candidatus Omnitrophica bacterium]|nr:adenylyl-sulfate kinase [Candidatus Omnitrophota bacterium]
MTLSKLPKMNIVVVGHVDHGKSTLIGRLLADTHSLPQGKLEQVKAECRRHAKPFEYAFLLDALKDEQAQGITIDTARCFFKSKKRQYIIIDAPGHIEFLKNMISGAARAEAALLVIDAGEGIQENSRRHGYLLSMLGIRQVAICVNKMDLVEYRQEAFDKIEKEYRKFLKEIELTPKVFLPIAAREGENIINRPARMKWFQGPSLLEILDSFEKAPSPQDKPFRMPVQGIYKFTESGDTRRIFAGRVESGAVSVGDKVIFLPSNKRSTLKSIEGFNAPARKKISAGYSAGVTLTEQIYINRGDILCKEGEPLPHVSSLMKVKVFWLGKKPMAMGKEYKLKSGTSAVPVRLKEIKRVLDASALTKLNKKIVERNDVAEVVLESSRPVAFDLSSELETTSRFVIVDEYDISGGGIIAEVVKDEQSPVREQISIRDQMWDFSVIDPEQRALRYGHQSKLILLTGSVGMDKKTIAKELEKILFETGIKTYFLPMGNLLRGLDAHVESHRASRREHIHHLGEIAHLFLDAGIIVVATASNLTDEELRELQEVTERDSIVIANVGKNNFHGPIVALDLSEKENPVKNARKIVGFLKEKKVLL